LAIGESKRARLSKQAKSAHRTCRNALRICAPGDSVVMSALVLTCPMYTLKQCCSGEGPWHSHAATRYRNLSSDELYSQGSAAASSERRPRDVIDSRRRGDRTG
nr:hypothetical protein [Tanacetum cinerariifolium]